MTMKQEKRSMNPDVDLIVANCVANQALEGLVCTPEDEAACRRIVTGETTLDQELETVIRKYRKVSSLKKSTNFDTGT